MGRSIIKQGNGNYAVWSTIVDNFILYNATPEDIVADFIHEKKQEIVEMVDRQIKKPNMTIEECLERIKIVHGSKELKKVSKIIQ